MSITPDNCFHLTVDIVREIHARAIENFGGRRFVRAAGPGATGVGGGSATGNVDRGPKFALPGFDGSGGGVFVLSLPQSPLHRRQ